MFSIVTNSFSIFHFFTKKKLPFITKRSIRKNELKNLITSP
nr:MAG TPA: hypothetical protein [Crassvirales sp.]